MKIKKALLKIRGTLVFIISIVIASVALFVLDLLEILPFNGTVITIYFAAIILFAVAMYARRAFSKK